MLCLKYLTMHDVQIHAGAIRKMVCVVVREIIYSLKLMDYFAYKSTQDTITYPTVTYMSNTTETNLATLNQCLINLKIGLSHE